MLAPGGFTVELQASPMTAEEVWSRELDWRMRLVWIFDAAAAFSAGRLRVWRSAGQQADGQPVVFGGERFRRRPPEKRDAWDVSWSRAPERVKSACCRSILDLGGDLIYVGAWEVPGRPLRGYGWPVTREWVAVNVLNGQAIPEPAPGRRYFAQEAVAAKAARDFGQLPYRQHWPAPADRRGAGRPRCLNEVGPGKRRVSSAAGSPAVATRTASRAATAAGIQAHRRTSPLTSCGSWA